MRILLWHGYLLSGTGSNIYTWALAREWSRAGHEVVVVCQEPHPEEFELDGAVVIRPDLPGGLLPTFILDRYEGLRPKLLTECTQEERERYVEANAAFLRDLLPADLVFANHALMGGPVAAATGVPHIVKIHGSELEYAIRGRPDLAAWACESLEGAEAVIVGSEHIRQVLHEVVGEVDNVHEVPPGVDVDEFRPEPREQALAALLEECRRDPPNPGNREERLPYEGNADRLTEFFHRPGPVVVYVGKLLRNKGVHVLFEALRGLDARGLIVGFGDYREELEAIAPANVLFTGALEHRHLVHVLRCATSRSCRRSSPRPSGWSPPKRQPRASRRSSRATQGWPRSRRAWRSATRRRTVTLRASRAATRASCGPSSRSCSGCRRRNAASSGALRAKRPSSAGRGRAWPSGCWRSQHNPDRRALLFRGGGRAAPEP